MLSIVAQAEVIVPPGLEVKESNIPKAGRGVFAKCVIPKHDFFGPFIGKKIPAEDAKKYKDSLYVWEVRSCFICLLFKQQNKIIMIVWWTMRQGGLRRTGAKGPIWPEFILVSLA